MSGDPSRAVSGSLSNNFESARSAGGTSSAISSDEGAILSSRDPRVQKDFLTSFMIWSKGRVFRRLSLRVWSPA